MRILIAGATGTLGIPITEQFVAAGHEVIGLSSSPANHDRLRSLGARPLIANALERDERLRAVDGLEVDVVVNELTSLKTTLAKHEHMKPTNLLRTIGTQNLMEVAGVTGARRVVTQSMIFGYGFGDWGEHVITEDDRFGPPGKGPLERHVGAMRSAEQQTFAAGGIEGIALRYGLIHKSASEMDGMVEMLRRRRFPIPRGGGGVLSRIYIDDAVSATIAAVERGRAGEAYNIVDDEPANWSDFLGELADLNNAPHPMELPAWLIGVIAPYGKAILTSTLRVSNAKAKRELGWSPRMSTYREGLHAAEAQPAATRLAHATP